MSRRRPFLTLGVALLSVLLVPAVSTAQDQSTPPQTAPPQQQQPGQQQSPAPKAPVPSPSGSATPSAAAPNGRASPMQVAIDASGGPSTLSEHVRAAIATWTKAAPGQVALEPAPKAPSTVRYATPALLGPDTLSLDLRRPGNDGVEIQVSADAIQAHPMVLLHEVGVLLGLPEGGQGVMAFAVPANKEPDAPTAADVAALKAQHSYAREDLNRDGTVDFYDLVLFGQAFGSQGVNLPADFNGDGRVDDSDLAMLEKAYRFAPPSQTAPTTGGAAPAMPASGTPAATTTPPTTTPPAAPPTGGASSPSTGGGTGAGGDAGSTTPP